LSLKQISIIIPVLCDKKAPYIHDRLVSLLENIRGRGIPEIETIVVDYSPKPSQLIEDNCDQYIKEDYVKIFNPARARNVAVKHASAEYLFLHDVDLLYSVEFYDYLILEVDKLRSRGFQSFAMLPCLYLTSEGTNKLQSNILDYENLKQSYLKGESAYVSHLAACSSALLMQRAYYLELGGMDESFEGHGCEDFDLIHKLVMNQPLSKIEDDYYDDFVTQFPADYRGFRKYMLYYSLPYLFTPLYLVHLHHDRPLMNFFYFNRRNNEKKLQENMKRYTSAKGGEEKGLQPIDNFIHSLMGKSSFNVEVFPGLFKYKDGVDGRKGTITSKFRKLIMRPDRFIKDSKIYKILFNS